MSLCSLLYRPWIVELVGRAEWTAQQKFRRSVVLNRALTTDGQDALQNATNKGSAMNKKKQNRERIPTHPVLYIFHAIPTSIRCSGSFGRDEF